VEPGNKNRLILVALALVFFGPLLVAFLLTNAGWHPDKTRSYGMLVEPAVDVSKTVVTLNDASKLVWIDPQWHWTLLAVAGPTCAEKCKEALAAVLRMRITLGRNAERLRVVYLGPALPPDMLSAWAALSGGVDDAGALSAYKPVADDTLALALVNPNGLLILRDDPGFDVARVREDLVKVVH
jgi:hypothetical protein